jgi:hypothetical protein
MGGAVAASPDRSFRAARQEVGRFAILLLVLISLITFVPFLPGGQDDGMLQSIMWTALFLAAVFTQWEGRLAWWTAILVATPGVVTRWSDTLAPDVHSLVMLRPAASAVFIGFIAIVLLARVLRSEHISLDAVLGGVIVYLLFGVMFAELHIATEAAAPGAYMLGDVTISSLVADGESMQQIFQYFSFTTLTTLGYGDIRPVHELARVLCTTEALLGQLYVAILIATLVGDHLRDARHREEVERRREFGEQRPISERNLMPPAE